MHSGCPNRGVFHFMSERKVFLKIIVLDENSLRYLNEGCLGLI
jgi:hypothetical protein